MRLRNSKCKYRSILILDLWKSTDPVDNVAWPNLGIWACRQSAVSGTRIFKSGLRKCESSGLVADVKIWALYTAELDSAVSQTPGKPRTAEHNSAVSCTPQSLTLRCMAYPVA